MKIILLCITLQFLLISCTSTQPTPLQIAEKKAQETARVAKEIETRKIAVKNSEIIADFIANEIWNKPINTLMEGKLRRPNNSASWFSTKKVMPAVTYNKKRLMKRYKDERRMYEGCGPSEDNQDIFVQIRSVDRSWSRTGRQYSVTLESGMKTDVNRLYRRALAKIKVGKRPGYFEEKELQRRNKNGNHDTSIKCDYELNWPWLRTIDLVDPEEFKALLLERGLPLIYCHHRDTEYWSNKATHCSIEWHKQRMSRSFAFENVYREGSSGMTNQISIYGLNISKSEEHQSFEQIYNKRLGENKKYADKVAAYNNEMREAYYEEATDKLKRLNKYRIEKEKREEAETRDFWRRSKAKNARERAANPWRTGLNPSKLDKQEQQYMNALDSAGSVNNVNRASSNIPITSPSRKKYSQPENIQSTWDEKKADKTQEAEKQNCLNAGKKWNDGCDYSTTIQIQGWTEGNRATVQPASTMSDAVSSAGSTNRHGAGIADDASSQTFGGRTSNPPATSNAPDAWAYCWETTLGNFMCDGPLQRLLAGVKTLNQALEATDCPNATYTTDNWYDCNRKLKWTEFHKERNVRSLRE
jgi:hypothetical protein